MSESVTGAELVCRNTWQPAGTSGQTLAHSWRSNCKLSDWTINWPTQKPEIFPTGLGWTVACVISHVGYNVKPAAMETNSSNIVKNTLAVLDFFYKLCISFMFKQWSGPNGSNVEF